MSGSQNPPTRLARLRVDADAIAENWRHFDRLAPNAVTAAVVKADGYGLGSERAALALAKAGARDFFTATSGEACALRRTLGGGPRIFVLNGPLSEDVANFAAAQLIPVLNSTEQIVLWAARAPAALHIDTGMNRLGAAPCDLAQVRHALKDAPLTLLMSHLACAADVTHSMNARQRQLFIEAASQFPGAPLSLAATSGALIGAGFHFDMIRPGIGLYGAGGLDANNPKLATAALIEAPILQLRDVAAGATFGYGATFTAAKKMRSATVALGYADGYLRSLSGRGYGVLGVVKLPLLGRVSMDLVALDVSECKEARVGDWVEFLGPNVPLDDVARLAGTAPYEILTTFAGMVGKAGVRE